MTSLWGRDIPFWKGKGINAPYLTIVAWLLLLEGTYNQAGENKFGRKRIFF